VAIAATAVTSAQTSTGTITGTVRDASGGTVPGATVTILNQMTRGAVATTSDSHGAYRVADLPAGSYRLETTLDGFEPAVREVALATGQSADIQLTLTPARVTEGVVVTARRVEEAAQDVPIALSIVSRSLVENAGAFDVNRLKELIPTVQFYSTNPRNSAINIRGLGAPFGLTNDGLEPGVGLYVDGVFYSRPASATLDFLDVDRIEVLRGPQGTLFGKNTTAGAINVTTRKPSFTKGADVELNLGDLGFVQAKASATGPLGAKIAGRLSFSGTSRDGTVFNAKTQQAVNDLDNAGLRGQLLVAPSDKIAITWATDYTRQRPDGYTQVVAGVAPTLRSANRQYPQIAADLHYAPPSFNAFDRVTDVDSPLRSYQDLGGSSLNVDWKIGRGVLTATGGWRFWNWNPSSDRDFIGLPVTTVSAAPSQQRQWSEEVRYAGSLAPRVDFVVGGFAFHQTIDSYPSFKQEQGAAAARFLLAPTPAAATPGLLDGYGFNQYVHYGNTSAAVFGQADVAVTDRLRLLPGLRFNYDQKKVDFDQQVYGGLQTTDPALVALQLSVLAPQQYKAHVDDTNVSGQFTAAYRLSGRVNAYATYATGFKSVGLNLNGVPTDAQNQPVLSAAVVKPEDVYNVEVGVKTQIVRGVTVNVTAYDTEIKNFQTQVTNASVGVLRGYLANAEKVRVRGVEIDGTARVNRNASVYAALAYTDGKYVTFVDAPPPLEETGGVREVGNDPPPFRTAVRRG
jgi:iron complex outermembrane receptor protein